MSANVAIIAPPLLGRPGDRASALPGCKQAPKASGENEDHRAQRLAAHRHRQQHHVLLRPLRDGPGRVHRAAHAHRRRARRRPRPHQGGVRAAGRRVHQQPASARRSPAAAPACATPGKNCARPAPPRARCSSTAAAQEWGVDAAQLQGRRRRDRLAADSRSCTFGDVAEAASKLPVPKDVPLKPASQFTLIGKRAAASTRPSKVDGSAIYGIDVKLPGMLYAALAQSPALGGSVKSFDDEKARAMPGVVASRAHLIRRRRGRGLLVARAQGARRARRSSGMRARTPRSTTRRSRATLRKGAAGAGRVARNDGDAAAAIKGAARVVRADYELPMLAHATLEPQNCTADVRADGAISTCRRRSSRSRRPPRRRPRG